MRKAPVHDVVLRLHLRHLFRKQKEFVKKVKEWVLFLKELLR